MKQQTLEEVQAAFSASVRAAIENAVTGEYDRAAMHSASEALVELRLLYTNRDGMPDLGGSSFEYRQAVGQGLSDAGVTPETRPKVLAALRYHVGNRLRERFTADELADYGMLAKKPAERQQAERAHLASIVRVATNPRAEVTEPDDVVSALQMAVQILNNVTLTGLGKADRKATEVYLDQIRHRVAQM